MERPPRQQLFHRTELLLGHDLLERLRRTKIVIFGVGGVGSWCAEALIRSGVDSLTIVDPDVICPTNVNRQLQATAMNVGQPKAEALRKHLLEINPEAKIEAVQAMFNADTCPDFHLGSYDYVLDAIDTLSCKVTLLRKSLDAGVKVYSSMGAGAKLDVTKIRTAPIEETRQCPLARMVRKRLHQAGETRPILCVYSEEVPMENRGKTFCGGKVCVCPDNAEKELCMSKSKITGTMVHMTAAFGFALAGLVFQDIASLHEAASPKPAQPS